MSKKLGRNPLDKKQVSVAKATLFKEVVKPVTSLEKIKEMQLEVNWMELANSAFKVFKNVLMISIILSLGCVTKKTNGNDEAALKKQLLEMQKNQSRLTAQVEELNNKILILNDKMHSKVNPPTASKVEETKESLAGDVKLYEMAIEDLKNKSFDPFKKKVELLAKGYKDSPLTNNALFLLGETYFKSADYKNAALTFEKLYSMSPDGNRAVMSLYMLGRSYQQMGRKQEAKEAYQSIINIYPGSREAVEAAKKLREKKI